MGKVTKEAMGQTNRDTRKGIWGNILETEGVNVCLLEMHLLTKIIFIVWSRC